MTTSAWQRRIERAQHLGQQFPFAREILQLYIEVTRFQETVHKELVKTGSIKRMPADRELSVPSCPVNPTRFSSFLKVIERAGPPALVKRIFAKTDTKREAKPWT